MFLNLFPIMFSNTLFKKILSIGVLLLVMLLTVQSAFAGRGPTYVDRKGMAIGGYDPVAYFKQEKAIAGRAEFQYEWNGGLWSFSSADNLASFQQNPEKYAPQYGGYCAYAVANNSYARIDPTIFTVDDGKLYLNYNARVQKRWRKKQSTFINDADEYWPQLLEKQKK